MKQGELHIQPDVWLALANLDIYGPNRGVDKDVQEPARIAMLPRVFDVQKLQDYLKLFNVSAQIQRSIANCAEVTIGPYSVADKRALVSFTCRSTSESERIWQLQDVAIVLSMLTTNHKCDIRHSSLNEQVLWHRAGCGQYFYTAKERDTFVANHKNIVAQTVVSVDESNVSESSVEQDVMIEDVIDTSIVKEALESNTSVDDEMVSGNISAETDDTQVDTISDVKPLVTMARESDVVESIELKEYPENAKFVEKDGQMFAEGIWNKNGVSVPVSFAILHRGHTFTENECNALLAGDEIVIDDYVTRNNEIKTVRGKLAVITDVSRQSRVGFERTDKKPKTGSLESFKANLKS